MTKRFIENLTNFVYYEEDMEIKQKVVEIARAEYERQNREKIRRIGDQYATYFGYDISINGGSSCSYFILYVYEKAGYHLHKSISNAQKMAYVPSFVQASAGRFIFFKWPEDEEDVFPEMGDMILLNMNRDWSVTPDHIALIDSVTDPFSRIETIECGYTINKIPNCIARDYWQKTSDRFIMFCRPVIYCNQ